MTYFENGIEYDVIEENGKKYIFDENGKWELCGIGRCLAEPSQKWIDDKNREVELCLLVPQPPTLEERTQALEDVVTALLFGGGPSV